MLSTTNESPRKQLAAQVSELKLTKAPVAVLDEPILMPNPNRFVLFPIKYHEVT